MYSIIRLYEQNMQSRNTIVEYRALRTNNQRINHKLEKYFYVSW